jgi:predicted transcriptional regulator of viral defense system
MSYSTYAKLQSLKRPYLSQTELKFILGGTKDSQFAKVKRAVANKVLTRIRRGLYCLSHPWGGEKPHPFSLAERIYGPSFISLESALSNHGLIPEGVKIVTSVTARRQNYFKTPLGDYSYMTVPKNNFLLSVERVVDGEAVYFMATPWRAIADYVYCYKKKWNTIEPLVASLRMELEDLPQLTQEEADELIEYYHHTRITQFLLNAVMTQ